MTSAAPPAQSVFSASTPRTTPITSARFSTTNERSSSIPTDMKKAALNRIWRGRISPSACWLNRLSLTITPARKAPSERESPARLVSQAVPKQIATTLKRNSSCEHVRATSSSTGGMRRRAKSRAKTMIAAAVSSAKATSTPDPPLVPSIGTRSTIGTIARSWKIRTPIEKRPAGA